MVDWRRLLKWLASYPLERGRAKRPPPPGPRVLSPTGNALRDLYRRQLLEAERRIVFEQFGKTGLPPRLPRTMAWRRYGAFTGVDDVPRDQEVSPLSGPGGDGLG